MLTVTLQDAQALQGEARFQAYSCLDTTGTREVYDTLIGRLDEDQRRIYAWNLAQQSPALTMALRGMRVNDLARGEARDQIQKDLRVEYKKVDADPLVREFWKETELDTSKCPKAGLGKSGKPKYHKWPRAKKGEPPLSPTAMVCEVCGTSRLRPKPFEASSTDQVKRLLYGLLQIPVQTNKEGKPTVNSEALERIKEDAFQWTLTNNGTRRRKKLPGLPALCDKLLVVRDLEKQLIFMKCVLSPAGRFHSSFNVSAPWTGRWSSSKNPYRWGGNLQNVGEQHRHIFEPDVGYKMFYADLKTAESLKVAYLSGDEKYIEAHKGDVHTYVTRLLWPDLAWTGDIKADKKIASNTYPDWDNVPGHDLRFQSKRIQHGSNYGLSPMGMAMIAHIPVVHARHAQMMYFEAFPMIKEWHKAMQARVHAQVPIYNALRRVVRLFGRPDDGHTFKQALAFPPQSGIGDVLNLGLWRVWNECDAQDRERQIVQLLAQVHDAILGQYPDAWESAALDALFRLMKVEVEVEDIRGVTRTMVILVEVATGYNWGKRNTDPEKGRLNPKGLEEVKWPLAA